MTAKKAVNPKRQAAPEAGSPAAPLGDYYVIRPGGDFAEHWPAGVASLGPALDRLVFLSMAGPAQRLSVHKPGEGSHVMFEYVAGNCTQRPASVIPAARKAG